jgi:alkanesulfonate monooxygenase SsuD/methylene tetrahydromethanopterin reductase-like flavin-dependent oxidoreductase (luciferase family)
MIFVVYPNLEAGKQNYANLKQMAADRNRDPDSMRICHLCSPIVAETRAEAEDKAALIGSLPTLSDSLMLLSEALNFDFGSKPIDEPFTDEELASMSGLQTMRDRTIAATGKSNPTVQDFIDVTQRGKLRDPWVGSGKDIADIFEEWYTAPACDGFVITGLYVPGSYEDFVKWVVPELQRRGLFHKDYAGKTLRENLGLARPERRAWMTVNRKS